MADAKAYADRFSLPPDQRAALIALDLPAIVKMGAHPLVPFLAQLQIQRLRAAYGEGRAEDFIALLAAAGALPAAGRCCSMLQDLRSGF